MHLLQAVEAVNGGSANPAFSGIPVWEQQLNLGYRLTAIGGSDNHRPMIPLDQAGSIGRPTTVVYAAALSTPDILDGIRAGRVFIDLTGSQDRILDVHAQAGSSSAVMGGDLRVPSGDDIVVEVHVVGCQGATANLLADGNPSPPLSPQSVTAPDENLRFHLQADGKRGWLLVEIRDNRGQLLLLGNPVYLNWDSPPASQGSRN
jgi:hypothetical protein